jgi:hypothetical protein
MSTQINAGRLPRVLSGTSDQGQMSLRGHLVIHARSPTGVAVGTRYPLLLDWSSPRQVGCPSPPGRLRLMESSEQVGQLVTDCRGGDSHR